MCVLFGMRRHRCELVADHDAIRAGLKLESSKGPAEVLVIDSVEKPSEN